MLVSSASKETMVDSRKAEAMAETQNDPAGRLEVVEQKLDRLSASADERFNQIDKRFDGIEPALVEQREYTEFAYGRLETKFDGLATGFARLELKMDQIIDLHLPKTPPGSSDAAR